MRKLNFTLACLLLMAIAIVSCKKTDNNTPTSTTTQQTNSSPYHGTPTISGYVTPYYTGSDTLAKGYTNPAAPLKLKGTLKAGTYYLDGYVYVPVGDTLFVESGVTIMAIGGSASTASPYGFTIRGTFISQGTQTSPNLFTVPDAYKSLNGGYGGCWTGLNADSAQNFTLKWTKVEYMGGPSGTSATTLGISCEYTQAIDVEDSWIRFTYDDGFRIHSTVNCIVQRNTFEHCGGTGGGESLNIKDGATGDISYNIFWNSATKCIKLETNATALVPQTSYNIYNNTCINTGFRNTAKPGPGTSIDLNTWANVWNNLYINCSRGFMEYYTTASGADTVHSRYNYNGFFSTNTNIDSSAPGITGGQYFTEPLDDEYYTGYAPQYPPSPISGGDIGVVGYPQPNDVFIPVAPASSQTVIVKLDDYSTDIALTDWEIGTGGFGGTAPYNPTLASGSPVIGKGFSAGLPAAYLHGGAAGKGVVTNTTWVTYQNQGRSGLTITPTPGADLGAKQSTSSSQQYQNQH